MEHGGGKHMLRKLSFMISILTLGLGSCMGHAPLVVPDLAPLPASFPAIGRHPAAANFTNYGRGTLSTLPAYDPNSTNTWQMDLRFYDLSGLDLSDSLGASFLLVQSKHETLAILARGVDQRGLPVVGAQ
jgi:hypothetical protein